MDCVYPQDVPLVMSRWNTLMQGKPVTFELRWKARAQSATTTGEDQPQPEAGLWIQASCVPVFDETGKLQSIAGNTIDISVSCTHLSLVFRDKHCTNLN
jgi:hypothetical protein